MCSYEVEPALLLPRVPPGTELDLWQGKAYVSLVAFLFLNTRFLGIPIPFHRNFEEANLRFYVRRTESDVVKRGVVFIKEIVPRWAIAAVARLAYNENYASMPMSHHVETITGPEPATSVEYRWRFRSRLNRLSLRASGEPHTPEPGSIEQFISEHYWGYCVTRGGGCLEYQVSHPPWQVWPAAGVHIDCDIAGIYGREFAGPLSERPVSAFLAGGSPVTVYQGTRIANP